MSGVARSQVLRLAACIVCGAAVAAGAQRGEPDGRTAPARISSASCVRDGARLLGTFRGRFAVDAAFRTGPDAWEHTSGTAMLDWRLGGCILAEHFDGTRSGAPYAYEALWGTSGMDDHRMQRAVIQSQHGIIVLSEGGWNAARDTLTLLDSAHVGTRRVWQRTVIVSVSDGFDLVAQRSDDAGKSWIDVQRFAYRRSRR